jgi:hypothetical protein
MKTYRSWEITSWPEVLWKVPTSRLRWPVFHHMGTDVRADSDEYGRAMGDTVWAARIDDDQIFGLAWEWIEVQQGVPAIRDPNGLISNIRLLDKHGDELDELQAVVRLNRVAHVTPWQGVVSHFLRTGVAPADTVAGPQPMPTERRQSAATELALLRELVAALPFQARSQPGVLSA